MEYPSLLHLISNIIVQSRSQSQYPTRLPFKDLFIYLSLSSLYNLLFNLPEEEGREGGRDLSLRLDRQTDR